MRDLGERKNERQNLREMNEGESKRVCEREGRERMRERDRVSVREREERG